MESTTSRDGTTVAYRRSGSGPPLLLVHGTTADHTRWNLVARTFEDRHTVYAMDRRGRGGSGDSSPYEIAREAEDVLAVIERIGEPANVLGHSFGAICCLEAARLSDAVRRLVLYEPPIPVGSEFVSAAIRSRIDAIVERGDLEAALVCFFEEVVGLSAQDLQTMRALPVWQRRVALAHTIPRELRVDELYRFDAGQFQAMSAPTLLLLGGDSPSLFRKATEVVNAALPDGRIVVMPGQRHVAIDTAPGLFTDQVLRFLS